MSCIASFHLVDFSDCEALAVSAEFVPKPRKILGVIPRKIIDYKELFWKTLEMKGKELEEFQYSGWAFSHLFVMYPTFVNTSKSKLGKRLTAAMGATYLSFTETEAHLALMVLGSNCLSSETLLKYFEAEGCPDEAEDWNVPVQASYNILKKWLSCVEKNKTGLLSMSF